MREIGTFDDEAVAGRLVDHLTALDMPAEARAARSGWAVWIHREDQLAAARGELDAFRADPDAPRYREAARLAREKRKEADRLEREHRKRTVELRDRLNVVSPARCPVTHALIGISIAVALYSGFGSKVRALEPFYLSPPSYELVVRDDAGGGDPSPVAAVLVPRSSGLGPILRGQVWRLFTPMFIHYGAMHLIFNMGALYFFGGRIELRKNSRTLLLLALTASPVSFLGQYAWDQYSHGPTYFSLPGGMSGVVYALFGYFWMKSDYEPEAGLTLPSQSIVWMLGWLLACMTGIFGPIANAAHVAGLVFGMLVGLGPHLWESLRWRR